MRFISLNVETGRQNFRYERTGFGFYSGAMHPTKSEFATAMARIPYGVYIYDATQETQPPRYPMLDLTHVVAYSPDGSYLAGISKFGGILTIWDTETGEITQTDTTTYSHHGAIQFIQNGAQMVVSGGNRLDFYNPNADAGELIRSVTYPEWESFAGVVSPDGERIWSSVLLPVGMTFEAVIRSFDLNGIPLTDEIRLDASVGGGVASSPIIDVVYSPDGQFVLTTERNGSIRFRNPDTFEPITRVYHPTNGGLNVRLTFANDGEYFVTYGEDDETVRVWTKQGLSVATFDIPPSDQRAFGISGLSISADGGRVAYSGGYEVYVWDVASNTRIFEMTLDAGNIIGTIALHPNGDILAMTNSSTGILFLYDVNTGEQLVRRPATRIISTLTFTPDGALLVGIGREDGIIRFWGVTR
jgi:WD40 repeat protein